MKFSLRHRSLRHSAAIGASLVLLCGMSFAQTPKFQVEKTWHIGGDGGWDYLTADAGAHRLYIARGNRVQVVDIHTGKLIAEMSGMDHTHGIALNTNGKYGYVSDGGAGMVRVFDRATLKVIANVPAEKNPDAIIFDPATKRVFAFNGRSNSATAIDTSTNRALQNVPLPGGPEFAQADGSGNVYVNLEDKNQIERIDSRTLKTTANWSISPCDSPSGLSIDRAHHRLFSVCDNKVMAVVDTDNGRVVATVAIGNGPDATRYNARRHLVFSPNGQDGTLTIVRQNSPDSYTPVQTVVTQKGARTMALDRATGTIYLVTAKFGPRPPTTASNPHRRPAIVPDSFVVLVVGAK
ncbi:MAG: YncE family protein [Acidobacteriaceae bacterium]